MGSMIMVARREFTSETGRKCYVYAFAVHEVHDPKTPSRWLRFFASGNSPNLTKHVFVAVKKHSGLSSNTLFSLATTPNAKRERIEEELKQSCGPLSIDQRTGCWFKGKEMRISGTMSGKIVSCTSSFEELELDETLEILLGQCVKSWFGRHKGSGAMKQGSLNEVPAMEQVESFEWVLELYEVGILQMRPHSMIAVSPDGIGKIKVTNEVEFQTASFELKTRLSDQTTIATAEQMADEYGVLVECDWGDEVCNHCIPSGNRKQVIHQVVVTGLYYCVFVTSKVVEGEG